MFVSKLQNCQPQLTIRRDYWPCLANEGCRLTLLNSRNDILLLTLPRPDLNDDCSSLTIFCVLERGFDCLWTTPADRFRSRRKDSLSVANFRRAFSKSTSSNGLLPFVWEGLIVALLRLLAVPLVSDILKDVIDILLSDWFENRLYDIRGELNRELDRFPASPPSPSSLSSSIVGSLYDLGASSSSSSGPNSSWSLSRPEIWLSTGLYSSEVWHAAYEEPVCQWSQGLFR